MQTLLQQLDASLHAVLVQRSRTGLPTNCPAGAGHAVQLLPVHAVCGPRAAHDLRGKA